MGRWIVVNVMKFINSLTVDSSFFEIIHWKWQQKNLWLRETIDFWIWLNGKIDFKIEKTIFYQ